MFREIPQNVTVCDGGTDGGSGVGGWFPGAVRLPSGELLALYSTGVEFEGKQAVSASRSIDGGRTWRCEGTLFDGIAAGPGSLKPTLLRDGRLIATGYFFDPSGALVNPATGGLAPGGNYAAFSADGGHTWTPPRRIDTGHPEVLETSGPCLELADGDLLSVCTPFPMWDGTMPSGRRGLLLRSTDGGRSWRDGGVFFRSAAGNVSPYESRIVQLPGGRLVVMLWCLDESAGKSLNNHVLFSDDGGATWSAPLDTGIAGQASNLLPLADGTLLAIHSLREGDDIGLLLCHAAIAEGRWNVLRQAKLWDDTRAGRIGSLAEMGENLKFGQPSLLALPDGEFLALFWAMEDGAGRILGCRFRLDPRG